MKPPAPAPQELLSPLALARHQAMAEALAEIPAAPQYLAPLLVNFNGSLMLLVLDLAEQHP